MQLGTELLARGQLRRLLGALSRSRLTLVCCLLASGCSADEPAPDQASLEGNGVLAQSSGDQQGPIRPGGSRGIDAASGGQSAPKQPTASQPGTKAYTHPLGLGVHHPDSWRVEESPYGLSLVPPDAQYNMNTPRELYLLNVLGLPPEVNSLDDPRVAPELTKYLQQTFPFLRSSGTPTPVPGRPDARTFEWRGTSPLNQQVLALVHGRIEQGYFLALSAIGEQQLVEKRRSTLLDVFRTMHWGNPSPSPALVGTWHTENRSSSGSISSDRINISHRQSWTFAPNGIVRSSSVMGVGGRTGGNSRPGTDIAGTVEGQPEAGRWAVSGRSLYILWRTGSVVKFEYYVQGTPGRREMLLTPAGGGSKMLWTEY